MSPLSPLRRRRASRRGSALLAVLWLSAALSAIVFTLALTVRAELERASTAVDSARAYFLAEGAIERFLMHLSMSGSVGPGADSRATFRPGQRRLRWGFPSGSVDLEITGESGKLNVYTASPQALARLLVNLGVDGGQAAQIAGGIAARRPGGQPNLAAGSSFSSSWPSFLQLEDLLTVGGMTPQVYYGWWDRDGEGRLVQRGGFARHVTLLEGGVVNVNYASPAVMAAAGVPDGLIAEIVAVREAKILEVAPQTGPLPEGMQLVAGGSSAYTVRATAQLTDRPVRRSVAALVRFGRNRMEPPLGVVRWYQTAQ